MRRRVALALATAVLFASAVALTYAIAFATDPGRRADAKVFDRVRHREGDSLRQFGHRVGADTLNGVAAAGVITVGCLLCVLTIAGKTRLRVWIIPTLIGGSFATTELLKSPLRSLTQTLAPLRVATTAYPSGHATLAMAIVVLVVMAALHHTRAATTIVAAVAATVLALLIVVGGLHPPSDVIGGYFVAGAWGAALTPAVRGNGKLDRNAKPGPALGRTALYAGGALLLLLSIFLGAYVEDAFGPRRILLGLVAALAIASTVIVVVIGVLADLDADRSGTAVVGNP